MLGQLENQLTNREYGLFGCIVYFCQCGFHQNFTFRKNNSKFIFGLPVWTIKKFFFFDNVGPIKYFLFWKLCSKMIFELVIHVIKISFFGNVGPSMDPQQ